MIVQLSPQTPFLLPLTRTHLRRTTTGAAATTDSGILFREKLLYLSSLNVNPHKALNLNPTLRSTPLSFILSLEHYLSSFGLPRSSLGRILDMLPQLLTADPQTDIYPVFEFLLNEVQIPFHDIRKCITRCPRLLICDVDRQLKPTFLFLRKLGFVGRNSINAHTTLLLVSSVTGTLLPKIEFLQSLGFRYEEVAKMAVRSPGLLTLSIEKNYKPKIEFFLEEMRGDLVELKSFPQYFSFSLEGRIKPRHRALLERGLVMPLPEMLKISDGEFNARLIEMRLQSVEGG